MLTSQFQIYFPTNTYIKLCLWTYQTEDVIEVNIFPSMYDQKISRGLCSKLGSDGKYFYAKDGETTDLATFIRSWRFANSVTIQRFLKQKQHSI